MLCVRCHKEIPQNKEVKLKDGSTACNECTERILKEYHKERYRKYLKGKINYEDLDPPGEGPIDDKILKKFLEISCINCLKSIAEYPNEEGFAKSSTTFYDKCQGKKCPDCGRIRQQINAEMKVFKNGFVGCMVVCPTCKKEVGYEVNGVCWDCFWDYEEKKRCICIVKYGEFWKCYCSLCEEEHVLDFKCAKCVELVKERTTTAPWKIIVPSVLGVIVLGAIASFLVVKKVSKKEPKKAKKNP